MLLLTRKPGERVIICGNIIVEVIGVTNGNVRLGFTAPNDVDIYREEIYQRIQRECESCE